MQNWCIAGCLRSGKSEVTELCNFKNAPAKSEVAALCKFTVGARFGAVFGACFWRPLGVSFWFVFGLVFWRPGRAGRASRALAFLALVLGAWAARVRRWRAVCFVPVAGAPVLLFSMARGAVRRGCAAWRRRGAGVCAVAARDFVYCGGARARAPGAGAGRACFVGALRGRRVGCVLALFVFVFAFAFRWRCRWLRALAARFDLSFCGRVRAALRALRFLFLVFQSAKFFFVYSCKVFPPWS